MNTTQKWNVKNALLSYYQKVIDKI